MTKELKIKLRLSFFFFCLFLIFSVIALLNPKWGTAYAPAEFRRSLDVVFAIDVSRSMDIRDTQTGRDLSRLEHGLLISRETAASAAGARFAAAIGRARGYLAVPLTFDNEAAIVFLESLNTSLMTGRSTNLETLIEAAADAFQSDSPARRIIVLVSDGESHAGVIRNAVNRCIREGIIINTVAVGSDEGRQIPLQADDPQSPLVISRRDSSVMRGIAERTGGIYIDANRSDAASALSSSLLSLAQDMEFSGSRKEPKSQRTLFIILALIAYGASKFVTRQQPRRITLVSVIALSVFFTSCFEDKLLLMEANYLYSRNRYDEAIIIYLKALNYENAAPYAEYGLALTFYHLDNEVTALRHYNDSQRLLEAFSAGEHRELRFRNHYNSGIILFEKEDYQSAAAAFKDALRIDPRRMDAKRNLELSLMSISLESRTENRTDSNQEQREILYDYLRHEEQQFWRSREWAPEEDHTLPDY
jgi:Ca-activated chloride channel family protein